MAAASHSTDPDPRFRRAVHAADRAARARDRTSTARSIRTTSATTSSARSRRSGIILSGSPDERHRRRDAARAAGGLRRWACRCSASATACRRWRAARRQRSRPARCASSAMPRCARAGIRRCSRDLEDRAQRRRPRAARRVDEPRRQGHRAAAGLQADRRRRPRARSRRWPTSRAASTRVQFHPEVTHTKQGAAILARFVHDICGCGTTGTCPTTSPRRSRRSARRSASDEVLLGLSGGVDSSVAAALIHQAIGDQLTCVFVDTACCARTRPSR